MKGISVIVPIYNVEAYVEKCIHSLLVSMKTYENVEVILINDGSTDSSGEIANQYAELDTRIHYFSQPNQGLANARNIGVAYTKYDYIAFVDSDDEVTSNYFHVLLKAMESKRDLYIFKAYLKRDEQLTILDGMDVLDELWTLQSNTGFKLYKRSLLEQVPFTDTLYEDVAFTYKLLAFLKSYQYIPMPLYVYRIGRPGSLLQTKSEKINDIYTVFEELIQFFTEREATTPEVMRGLTYQYVKLVIWSNTYRQLLLHRHRIWQYYVSLKRSRKFLKKHFTGWKQNDLLDKNAQFFQQRFGSSYKQLIEMLGATFITSLSATLYMAVLNRNRS